MCVECRRTPCPTDCINYEMKPVTSCGSCGDDIYLGDDYYQLKDDIICVDCIHKYKKTWSVRTDWRDAEALGSGSGTP